MGLFAAVLPKLIGTVAGGLLSRNAAKRDRRYALQDTIESLPRLRESAEKAGFNPLSALMATGGSGFNLGGTNTPPLASVEAITGALTDASDHMTGKAARQEQNEKAYSELLQLELEEKRAGGAADEVHRTVKQRGVPAVKPPVRQVDPAQPVLEVAPLMQTNPQLLGPDARIVNPRAPDAEHGEQRYGDIAQELTGFRNAAVDWWHDRRLRNIAEKYGDAAAEEIHQRFGAEADMDKTFSEIRDEVLKKYPRKDIRPKLRPLSPSRDRGWPTEMGPYNPLRIDITPKGN